MIRLIEGKGKPGDGPLLASMFADRKRVFVDMLSWDIPHDEVSERDEFDTPEALYVIAEEDGDHIASARLLPTSCGHVLDTHFADICERDIPRGEDVREISRYCLSPRYNAAVRAQARNVMATALAEFGLLLGIRGYTAVAHASRLASILSAGWRCNPLGLPTISHGMSVGALLIHIDTETIGLIRRAGRYARAIDFAPMPAAAAA